MKVKYIGRTIIPLALAIGTVPAVTNGEIYEVLHENNETNTYVFIDDSGMTKVMQRDNFEKVK